MTTSTYAFSPADLADAAVLVRFGCHPRLRPLQYRDLLQRYRTDGVLIDGLVCATKPSPSPNSAPSSCPTPRCCPNGR